MIKVYLFGELYIERTDKNGQVKSIGESEIHSPLAVRLLAMMLKNYPNPVTSENLISELWPDDDAKNPLGTLKNLVYRLRTALKGIGDEQFILTKSKAYSWNKDIPVELDVRIFEDEYKAGVHSTGGIRKNHFLKAIGEYRGCLLEKHQDVYWAVSNAIRLESQFKDMSMEVCETLLDEEDYALAEDVATQALRFDSLSEDLYSCLIRALIGQKKFKLALEQYHMAEETLYENLDVNTPEKLQELWPLLMKQVQSKESDIKKVQQDLMEDYKQGAFFCEYGIFKKIYQLELRRVDRMGISVYMSLISIGVSPRYEVNDPEKLNEMLLEAMNNLKELLLRNLRNGDVVTRYSKSQFIILLPTCQYETAKKVLERIKSAYVRSYPDSKMKLEYSSDSM